MIDRPCSTFYYRSTAVAEDLGDAWLAELIGSIQDEVPGYGYRRVTHELRRRGYVVNHKRVARVMTAQGLSIKLRRRFVRTTDSKHDSPIFPNLYRKVIPTRPNVVWVADFTYIRIASGFCYLAAILDACSRKVVGYAISRNIDTTLALAALRSAVQDRQPPAGCIFQTDRGSQYASETYRRALQEAGLRGSMSSPGNPYNNAHAESFMKTLKVEDVYIGGHETFGDVATGFHGSSKRSTARSGFTLHSAIFHPKNSNRNLLGRRLSSHEPRGPTPGVHSTLPPN